MSNQATAAERVRVLHAVDGPWLEQTQTWLYQQVRNLPAAIESHIVCQGTRNLDQFPAPNIHSTQDQPALVRVVDRALRKARLRRHFGLTDRVIRGRGIALIHSHFGPVGWYNCRLANERGIPHVVTFYGLDVNYLPSQGWADLYHELFDRVDRVLCEGPHMASCIVKLGCAAHKVKVHHLGVDVAQIPFRPRERAAGEPLRILIAASFREKKGVPDALEAVARVREHVPVEVVVIGDAGGDPAAQAEKKKILAVVEQRGLAECVQFLGYCPHAVLHEQAARCHVFLSPSVTASNGDTEGGAPVTIIEMAASGMPIVSTTHCDIPEVVRDGGMALLAPEHDVEGLAARLLSLARDWGQTRPMVAAARRRIEQEFDASTQGLRLAAHYSELLAARRRP